MADNNKPKLKPVSFLTDDDTDMKILNYVERNKLSFSNYVKALILDDMEKEQKDTDIVKAINNLTNIISNAFDNNVIVKKENQPLQNTNTRADSEQKNIISNIMNMPK